MYDSVRMRGTIPFNRPHLTGREFEYIREAVAAGQLAGNGQFTRRCQAWLQDQLGAPKVLLTHSCTAALEMCALLLDLRPGDEVIMPSFTFVSTANAFVLRGATPVFVDIRSDTLNIDESLIEAAITPRTRAIVVVHYAGVGCEMAAVAAVARRHGLTVIEDAAQGLMASYQGRPLGSLGDLAAFSFHETKNVQCGEGGALVMNDARWAERAEILWEKGTDRSKFTRGTGGQIHLGGRGVVVPAGRVDRSVSLGPTRGRRRHHRGADGVMAIVCGGQPRAAGCRHRNLRHPT